GSFVVLRVVTMRAVVEQQDQDHEDHPQDDQFLDGHGKSPSSGSNVLSVRYWASTSSCTRSASFNSSRKAVRRAGWIVTSRDSQPSTSAALASVSTSSPTSPSSSMRHATSPAASSQPKISSGSFC